MMMKRCMSMASKKDSTADLDAAKKAWMDKLPEVQRKRKQLEHESVEDAKVEESGWSERMTDLNRAANMTQVSAGPIEYTPGVTKEQVAKYLKLKEERPGALEDMEDGELKRELGLSDGQLVDLKSLVRNRWEFTKVKRMDEEQFKEREERRKQDVERLLRLREENPMREAELLAGVKEFRREQAKWELVKAGYFGDLPHETQCGERAYGKFVPAWMRGGDFSDLVPKLAVRKLSDYHMPMDREALSLDLRLFSRSVCEVLKKTVVPAAETLVWANYDEQRASMEDDLELLPHPLGLGAAEKIAELMLHLHIPVKRCANFLCDLTRKYGTEIWDQQGEPVLKRMRVMLEVRENSLKYLRENRGEFFVATSRRIENHSEQSHEMRSLRNVVHAAEQCVAMNHGGLLGLQQYATLFDALHDAHKKWNALVNGRYGQNQMLCRLEPLALRKQGVNVFNVDSDVSALTITVGIPEYYVRVNACPELKSADETFAKFEASFEAAEEAAEAADAAEEIVRAADAAEFARHAEEIVRAAEAEEAAAVSTVAAASTTGVKTSPACGGDDDTAQ